MVVALNPGHGQNGDGSFDPGAYNKELQLSEHAVNLRMVDAVKNILGTESINTFLTPIVVKQSSWGMLPMQVNTVKPDFIVSFHCNSHVYPTATGSEVLYWHSSKKGKILAKHLYDAIQSVLNLPFRAMPLKPITGYDRGAALFMHTVAPCAMIEPFFLSNAKDYEIFQNKFEAFSKQVAKAIIAFAKELPSIE